MWIERLLTVLEPFHTANNLLSGDNRRKLLVKLRQRDLMHRLSVKSHLIPRCRRGFKHSRRIPRHKHRESQIAGHACGGTHAVRGSQPKNDQGVDTVSLFAQYPGSFTVRRATNELTHAKVGLQAGPNKA